MKSLVTTIVLCAAATAVLPGHGAVPQGVLAACEQQQYDEAVRLLQPLVKKTPRDGELQYWLGRSQRGAGRRPEAVTAYKAAAARGWGEAWGDLAEMALELYDTDAAAGYLDSWGEAVAKTRKTAPQRLSTLRTRVTDLSNMLDRVEDIMVLDLEQYPPTGLDNELAMFVTPDGRLVFESVRGADGLYTILETPVLDDGTRGESTDLRPWLGDGNLRSPYMAPDGETLYFATDGDGSIGGLDIMYTRRDDDGYLDPVNPGMPYNSAADDYGYRLLDDGNAAVWRTNRSGAPVQYTFLTSETRHNLDPDSEDLASRARMDDITLTWRGDVDREGLLTRLNAAENSGATPPQPVYVPVSLGDGRILYGPPERQRDKYFQYQNQEKKLAQAQQEADELSTRLHNGNQSLAVKLAQARKNVEEQRRLALEKRNALIRALR